MKSVFLLVFVGFFSASFSQQQFGNVYAGNMNSPAQIIQTNILVNTANLNNDNNFNSNKSSDNNPIQQQVNYVDNNVGNEEQIQQSSNNSKQTNDVISNGKAVKLSFDFSSRSSSSSGMSSKKTNRKTFHKKLSKFNRNFYGKLASHKKSKHLVDVCFNWSK